MAFFVRSPLRSSLYRARIACRVFCCADTSATAAVVRIYFWKLSSRPTVKVCFLISRAMRPKRDFVAPLLYDAP